MTARIEHDPVPVRALLEGHVSRTRMNSEFVQRHGSWAKLLHRKFAIPWPVEGGSRFPVSL